MGKPLVKQGNVSDFVLPEEKDIDDGEVSGPAISPGEIKPKFGESISSVEEHKSSEFDSNLFQKAEDQMQPIVSIDDFDDEILSSGAADETDRRMAQIEYQS